MEDVADKEASRRNVKCWGTIKDEEKIQRGKKFMDDTKSNIL
jgi:hypothetical protein